MKPNKKLLFVYNPMAGKTKIRNYLSDIICIFMANGYETTVIPTQSGGDAEVICMNISDEYDLLVVSGGDGTLDEAVTGLMRGKISIPVGYIPSGSTNDFGNTLKIPKSMTAAAKIAVNSHEFKCDIGKFNDGYFVYVMAFGLFTNVTYETPQPEKNRIGFAAYVVEALRNLSDIQSYYMDVTADDEVFKGDFLLGLISNSNTVGGIEKLIGLPVSLNDGQFEIRLIRRPPSIVDLNEILLTLLDSRNTSEYVITRRCAKISIKCDEPVHWNLDGEYGGTYCEANVEVLPQKLTIHVP